MATTLTKWIVGCGIGCIVMIFILAAVTGGGFLCVRGMVRNFQAVEESQEELVDAFGSVSDYVPPADGDIDSERITRFILIRNELQSERQRLEERFAAFSPSHEDHGQSSFRIVDTIRGLTSLVPGIATYIRIRNTTLLDHSMGIGEYIYLYMIIYHSWLGHEPDDHPDIDHLVHSIDSSDSDGDRFESNFDSDEIRYRYRSIAVRFLENQIRAAESSNNIQDPSWISDLEHELQVLTDGTHPVLWQDGLPPVIRRCLEPYRSDLEQSYSATTNVFDLFFNDIDTDTTGTETRRIP